MSRQIQIRRGTAEKHANFTGAQGEITMDTTNNTLRVHDGATPGGIILARADDVSSGTTLPDTADYVIETQLPTAENNYTWYRKYKSGWVEQGGRSVSSATQAVQITLPKEMIDANYTISLTTTGYGSPNYDPCVVNIRHSTPPTKSCFSVQTKNHSSQMFSSPFFWMVQGIAN